jgi:hypothetical protein
VLNGSDNWEVLESTLRGDLEPWSGWRIEGSQIGGDVRVTSPDPVGINMRDCTVGGSVLATTTSGAAAGAFSDSSFTGLATLGDARFIASPANTTVLRCRFSNGIRLNRGSLRNSTVLVTNGNFLSGVAAEANIFNTGAVVYELQASDGSFVRNRVASRTFFQQMNAVADNLLLQSTTLQWGTVLSGFSGNFVRGSANEVFALKLRYGGNGSKGQLLVNNLIHRGDLDASAFAIREDTSLADPGAVLNNAFVGFSAGNLYLDEGTTPLADVATLNSLNQFAACAVGANQSFADNAAAGLVSSAIADPAVGKATMGPLTDSGRSAPYTCTTWTLGANATDISGSSPRVCRSSQDIGPYELCP